jgi:hypothetical protein
MKLFYRIFTAALVKGERVAVGMLVLTTPDTKVSGFEHDLRVYELPSIE